ncbi:hypothetical protein ACFPRL_10180 [Pseudoclavibacter helvolus]
MESGEGDDRGPHHPVVAGAGARARVSGAGCAFRLGSGRCGPHRLRERGHVSPPSAGSSGRRLFATRCRGSRGRRSRRRSRRGTPG